MKTLSLSLLLCTTATFPFTPAALGATPAGMPPLVQDDPVTALPEVRDHSEVQRNVDVMRRVLWKRMLARSPELQGISSVASRYYRLSNEQRADADTLQEYVRGNYGLPAAHQGSVDYLPGLAAVVRFDLPIRGRWVVPQQEAEPADPAPPEDLWQQSLEEAKAAEGGRSAAATLDGESVPYLSQIPLLSTLYADREAEYLAAVAAVQQGELEVDPDALRALIRTVGTALSQYGHRMGLREGEQLVVSLRLTPRAAAARYVASGQAETESTRQLLLSALATGNQAAVHPVTGQASSALTRTLVLRVPGAALKGGHEQSEAAFFSQLRVDYF